MKKKNINKNWPEPGWRLILWPALERKALLWLNQRLRHPQRRPWSSAWHRRRAPATKTVNEIRVTNSREDSAADLVLWIKKSRSPGIQPLEASEGEVELETEQRVAPQLSPILVELELVEAQLVTPPQSKHRLQTPVLTTLNDDKVPGKARGTATIPTQSLGEHHLRSRPDLYDEHLRKEINKLVTESCDCFFFVAFLWQGGHGHDDCRLPFWMETCDDRQAGIVERFHSAHFPATPREQAVGVNAFYAHCPFETQLKHIATAVTEQGQSGKVCELEVKHEGGQSKRGGGSSHQFTRRWSTAAWGMCGSLR